ncbi:MAG: sensor hybrid histidine kinase [Phycisphaerales bacterium]|nr:sensor hybrid histidine kinase [Phycisphaerales bacterium]
MSSDGGAKILVVDDNPAGRYSTSRILRAAGFTVTEAATGLDGLKNVADADAVVLDVNLPDIDGFEVCRRIRAQRQTSRVPVIHLSATFVKDVDKVQGLEAGADGYLTHPVEPPVLVATINAFLRARRAEDEMRQSEAKFRAIFDHALSGILLVSEDLACLEANPAMCHMVGRPREGIIGQHLSDFVPTESSIVARDLGLRGAWRGTFPLTRQDGSRVELEWNISAHSVPGVRLAIVTDITERQGHETERERLLMNERRAREDAERANRLKDDFLATLSHELRTPLNAIVGWSEILRSGKLSDKELAEAVEAIDRNARAQSQLISDLLDVSRITSGMFRLDVRPMDLAETINDALEALVNAVQAKEINLQRDLHRDASAIVGDPQRIQQVLWNLVNNAVKFTPRGGTINVTLDRENSHARITVTDTGQGINADFLPYIFERFRQEDATSKRNQGGLGLGLAIVKHLVEMHGGTVSAQSEGEGQGSSFVVRLPVAAMKPEAEAMIVRSATSAAAAPAPAFSPMALRGVRVLVVEDDEDARTLLKRSLVKAGAEVADAASVKVALDLLSTFRPTVLLSDVGMPDLDGYDLIREVRARGLTAGDLPAIALTAFARNEDETRSLEAGFQVHLSKPVDQNKLVETVASIAQPIRSE